MWPVRSRLSSPWLVSFLRPVPRRPAPGSPALATHANPVQSHGAVQDLRGRHFQDGYFRGNRRARSGGCRGVTITKSITIDGSTWISPGVLVSGTNRRHRRERPAFERGDPAQPRSQRRRHRDQRDPRSAGPAMFASRTARSTASRRASSTTERSVTSPSRTPSSATTGRRE